jgi:hypothetical protein
MQFGHEQLDVYRVSIQYVAWAYKVAKSLNGIDRHARDQLLRASQSIPLNIAEGNGNGTNADRRRYFVLERKPARIRQIPTAHCPVKSGVHSIRGEKEGEMSRDEIPSHLSRFQGARPPEVSRALGNLWG